MYMFLQPATIAGIICINIELNKGAEPPGTYKPTESIGLVSAHKLIPFVVSAGIKFNDLNCLSAKDSMFDLAINIDDLSSSEILFSALIKSSSETFRCFD